MKKNINTLIEDIYEVVSRKDGWFTEELSNMFAQDMGKRLSFQLGEKTDRPTLRISALGPRCPKALWHSIHTPELADKVPSRAEVMFSYGHIIEALVLVLAKAAGHEVTGEQDAVRIDGVLGHRDCVIDGNIVDVKSCGRILFDKFKTKSIKENDLFGYLDQLDGYLVASREDPLVTNKDSAYILAVDKQLGHMVLYEHVGREAHIRNRVKEFKDVVSRDKPPACTCGTVPHGKSGNIQLDTKASYNVFKHTCFPNLRTFIYANGPVYLTKVVQIPNVLEVDRYGKPVPG